MNRKDLSLLLFWCINANLNTHVQYSIEFCDKNITLQSISFDFLFQMASQTARISADAQLDCALDLMRRLPPQQVEKNLSDLIDLVPDLTEELLSAVDQPLKVVRDRTVGKDYLLCDYNRDGDSYRSPWTNTYTPPFDGTSSY